MFPSDARSDAGTLDPTAGFGVQGHEASKPAHPGAGGYCSSSFGTVSGTALDATGSAVAGAEVLLVQANDASNYEAASSDSNGAFRFMNVVPGDYFFTPNNADPSAAQATFVLAPGQDASQTFHVDSPP